MIFKISKDIDILKIDLTEHDKQIREEVIDKLLEISWHSIDLNDFRREVMKLKEQKK